MSDKPKVSKCKGCDAWVLRHYDGTDDLVAEIKFPDATQAEMETAFGIKLTKFGSTEWLVLGGHCYFIDFDAS